MNTNNPQHAGPATRTIDVVFDGPPEHIAGRFVEVEDSSGVSTSVGEWIDRGDGNWALRLELAPTALAPTAGLNENGENA